MGNVSLDEWLQTLENRLVDDAVHEGKSRIDAARQLQLKLGNSNFLPGSRLYSSSFAILFYTPYDMLWC